MSTSQRWQRCARSPPAQLAPAHAQALPQDFIEDDFNLTGLASLVPFYKEAMEMVLDVEPGASAHSRLHARADHHARAEEDEMHRVPDVSIVESSAELLYGLIHQRYILTRQGLQQMVRASSSSSSRAPA